jgi:catechol 2,3-dioxygenase-like lactoylglutathione lyase family enzyme
MRYRLLPLLCFVALVATASDARTQLAAPGGDGVVMGHLHFTGRDLDVQRQFWTTTLGGTAVENGPLQLIQFPGVFVMVRRGEPSAGTAGSIINHVGFAVKNLKAIVARVEAAGFTIEPLNPTQLFVIGPDDVRVELSEFPNQAEPIRMHHIHFYTAAIPEMQAWYVKHFGAVAGKRGQFAAADLPGVNLTFAAGEGTLPIRGRALDHIGFEVKDLPGLLKKLEAAGVKIDVAYRTVPKTKVGIAFVTDPWGTYIELTENLAP